MSTTAPTTHVAERTTRCTTFPAHVVTITNPILVKVGGKVYEKFKCSYCGFLHQVPRRMPETK
jgi:hypothetical protein